VTVQEIIREGIRFLSRCGVRNPRRDAELILCDLMRVDRVFLYSRPDHPVNPREESVFWEWLDRRARHYPIQYLRGFQEFYRRRFAVSPAVLIPRPETETVVDTLLEEVQRTKNPSLEVPRGRRQIRILEVGTGSGCIAVTLACEMESVRIVATDISSPALAVARQNASTHGCMEKITWLQADGLGAFPPGQRIYDLIVSNPPYISFHDESIDPAVAVYEPSCSVYAGDSGLELYRHLLEYSSGLLRFPGRLVLELGYGQANPVCSIAREVGWRLIQIKRDLAGIDRCAVFALQNPNPGP